MKMSKLQINMSPCSLIIINILTLFNSNLCFSNELIVKAAFFSFFCDGLDHKQWRTKTFLTV